MTSNILAYITGFGIARSTGLDDSRAAQIAILPGIIGFSVPSILIGWAVAKREADSRPQPILQNPDIGVEPKTHDYGEVKVGESASKNFAIKNTGNADLIVTGVTLGGDNRSEFRLVISDGVPFTVTPGTSNDRLMVIFTPASRGTKSATLSITSNDPDQRTVNIPLSGSGIGETQAAKSTEAETRATRQPK